MDKKTLIGVIGLALFLLLWMNVIVPSFPDEVMYKKAPPVASGNLSPTLESSPEPGPTLPTSPTAPSTGPITSTETAAPAPQAPALPVVEKAEETFVTIDTEIFKAVFSSWGGSLVHLESKDHKDLIGSDNAITLLDRASLVVDGKRDPMQSVVSDTDNGKTLTFWNTDRRVIYRFEEPSHFFDITVEPTQERAISLTLPELEPDPSFTKGAITRGNMGGIYHLNPRDDGDNSAAIPTSDLHGHQNLGAPGQLEYAGFRNIYFTTFLEPTEDNGSAHQLQFSVSAEGSNLILGASAQKAFTYRLYAGPVHKPYLYEIDEVKYGPLFNYTGIDFIIHFLLYLLSLYSSLPGVNMGVAILLLTLSVKLVLFPMTLKAQTSMFMMSKIGPELKALQEKYKNDRQQLGVKQMELFRENGVNPMAGCLPMLIQMPVFISLFSTIGEGFILRHAPFFGWITDLSAPDRFAIFNVSIPFLNNGDGTTNLNILVILYMITMLIQQSLMPKATDPQQQQMQKMMKFMMLAFGFILYNYSSGLMVYFVGSNILGMLENTYIRKSVLPAMEKKLENKT